MTDRQQLPDIPGRKLAPFELTGAFLTIFFLVVAIPILIVNHFFFDPSPERITKAAELTVAAQQREVERDGGYLGSKTALSASEPELGPFLIDGGLDRAKVESDGRFLGVEYQEEGQTIRLDFMDGNLVNVTCQGIDDCPSAAELYQAEQ